ncbi:MAG: BNR-4 repeat-containing protein [Planctomycetota bacterium]
MRKSMLLWIALLAATGLECDAAGDTFDLAYVNQLSDDASWCWFQDERAVFAGEMLVTTVIASGHREPSRSGNLEALVHDPETGESWRSVIHKGFELDDHNVATLVVLPDDRVMAVYAKHHREGCFYVAGSDRRSRYRVWTEPERVEMGEASRLTYANVFRVPTPVGGARLVNFFRGLNNEFRPSYAVSGDDGKTWTAGRVLLGGDVGVRSRPYVKYARAADGAIHLAYTEGHPRDIDNSIYHVVWREGRLESLGGELLADRDAAPLMPSRGAMVYRGGPQRVAWTHDLHLDDQGRPVVAFSVQRGSAGLPRGQGGDDLRYGLARWDGDTWRSALIGHAGSRLYAGEDDYAGGICLDPQQLDSHQRASGGCTVYASSNVDPVTGRPTTNGAYELFLGRVGGDLTCEWTALTLGANENQLRPMVAHGPTGRSALLWLVGEYTSYTDFRQRAMATTRRH